MISEIASIASKAFIIIMIVSIILMLPRFMFAFLGFGKRIVFNPKTSKKSKFAILIPARDESKVIGDLLLSLSRQNYPKENFDIFVIVKDENDRSIQITKKYGYNVLVNQNQTCKGEALDYALKYIYDSNLKYDSFLVFDADNVVTPNFLLEINKAVVSGYDIGMGYRNTKNWNESWVSASTALTFSLVNTLSNKGRSKLGRNCIFSGTGYFISSRVLDKFRGWPFRTLTEDYEISLYATLNNLKTTYVENAEFYDEQPKSLKTSFKQRVRWVKGFIQSGKIYNKKIFKSIFKDKENRISKIEQSIGMYPIIAIIASTIVYALLQIGLAIASVATGISAIPFVLKFFEILIKTYIVLMIFTVVQFLAESKRINVHLSTVLLTTILNPLYVAMYIPIGLKALLSKNIVWVKIEHENNMQIVIGKEGEQYEDDEARKTIKNS